MPSENREDYLIRVASLYYEQDYNQEQIAKMLATSRSNVSRLLKEAKQKGLVEIRIRKPVATVPILERRFRERFDLERVMIVESKGRTYADNLAAAGQLAARYLEEVLSPSETLAISWGTGVGAAVAGLGDCQHLQVDVVQMIGSVGTVDSEIDGHELARKLALKLGGRYYYLHAPLIVDSANTREVFMEQPTIREALARARRASVALLGVGTTEPGMSSFIRAKHLTDQELSNLRAQGAVGETAGRHFDINGNADRFDVNRRVIALDLADVKSIPHVIAVACGLAKRYSILGALRGGYIKALATEDVTAMAVLDAAG